MITYERGFLKILSRAFQCKGSVFPTSMCIALPCAALTALLKLCIDEGYLPALSNNGHNSILEDNSCWSGFVFLVGFLTVFRTSQAYARFWDGTTSMHHMRAEWFNACAALLAFCKYADATSDAVFEFQQTLVRLFSMLHAVALADIEDTNGNGPDSVAAYKYGLVDVGGIDSESLRVLKKSHAKAELVFQWIQQLIVENIDTGVLRIPPPILSRAFQEMANGMVAYHEAMKITTIPFPFPYAQVCDWLLLFHWVCTPLVVSQYVAAPWWGALFSFLQVFVYWSLNAIAVEIENPFGMDANDLDALGMQEELNRHLLLLVDPGTLRTPTLARADLDGGASGRPKLARRNSLTDVWKLFQSEQSSQGLDHPENTSNWGVTVSHAAPSDMHESSHQGDQHSAHTQNPASCGLVALDAANSLSRSSSKGRPTLQSVPEAPDPTTVGPGPAAVVDEIFGISGQSAAEALSVQSASSNDEDASLSRHSETLSLHAAEAGMDNTLSQVSGAPAIGSTTHLGSAPVDQTEPSDRHPACSSSRREHSPSSDMRRSLERVSAKTPQAHSRSEWLTNLGQITPPTRPFGPGAESAVGSIPPPPCTCETDPPSGQSFACPTATL